MNKIIAKKEMSREEALKAKTVSIEVIDRFLDAVSYDQSELVNEVNVRAARVIRKLGFKLDTGHLEVMNLLLDRLTKKIAISYAFGIWAALQGVSCGINKDNLKIINKLLADTSNFHNKYYLSGLEIVMTCLASSITKNNYQLILGFHQAILLKLDEKSQVKLLLHIILGLAKHARHSKPRLIKALLELIDHQQKGDPEIEIIMKTVKILSNKLSAQDLELRAALFDRLNKLETSSHYTVLAMDNILGARTPLKK